MRLPARLPVATCGTDDRLRLSLASSCRVAQHVQANSGRTTLSALGDLVRGLGGGSFDTVVARGKKRQRAKLANVKETIDLDEVCGGKLAMSREVRSPSLLRSGLEVAC